MLKFVLVPLAAAALAASVAPAGAQAFPDGPGKEILEKKCSTCHAPEQVTTFGRSAEEWHEVVINMIDLGAELNEEETKVLVEYLTKNWPVKGEKPAEKPAEQPAERPAEKPAEQPAEKPEEKPAEKPAEQPAEKPAEQPAEKPEEKPAEKPEEGSKPAPQSAPAAIAPVRSH